MLFNSINFLVFFPIVVAIYFVIPKKLRYIWLLAASYYFYMSWNPKYIVLIAFSTLVTYLSGMGISFTAKIGNEKKRKCIGKWIVFFSLAINLGILFFFKYFDFALRGMNHVLNSMHVEPITKSFDLLLPVGISFYTFQALSYTLDVYRGDIKAEKNILRYALFVSFFPQLVAGPIERSTSLMKQLRETENIKVWNYERITSGLVLMLWGYFVKMVIADRVSILVDQVFNAYTQYSQGALIIAALFFAFQIYCDFGGYSYIALGAAKIMGFTLMENFNTPYLSVSIQDFWRRWHISLSLWFRDYLYIPLGGSRKSRAAKYRNILITFLCSGLWHGASLSFVVWGGLHAVYQIIGDILKPVRKKMAEKMHISPEKGICKGIRILVTFILVDFAWIFFRANSLRRAVDYIHRICTSFGRPFISSTEVVALGLSAVELIVACVAIGVLVLVDLIQYKTGKNLDVYLNGQHIVLRWAVYIFLICSIFIFGIYGPAFQAANFIYFQF